MVGAVALLLVSAGSPDDSVRDLDNVEDKAVLFTRKVPGDGFWEFCLTGSKPKLDLFSFHVVLTRDAGVSRVDGVRLVRAEDERINVCARQDPKDAKEQKLRAGEKVDVVAIGRTRGPVHLSLAVHEVKAQ
jgi:hypothetical protein